MDDAARARFEECRFFADAERECARRAERLPGWISEDREDVLRYALNLARLRLVRSPRGADVDVWEELRDYRRVLRRTLEEHARLDRSKDDLSEHLPVIQRIAAEARRNLLAAHREDFGADALDKELCERALAVVCGGGGGAGLIYLGAFTLLEELGLAPALLVGTSMGAGMAFLRALARRWDPLNLPLRPPKGFAMNRVIRPGRARSRYGLPGLLHLDWHDAAEAMFRPSPWKGVPTPGDLPIPFLAVTTGLRRGFEERAAPTLGVLEGESAALSRPSSALRALRLFGKLARELAELRPMMKEVVLGGDDLTRAMPAHDAVGFSCSVPGVLHYDVLRWDRPAKKRLDALFEREGIARLTDGGVVSNVPARAAWEEAERGRLGTRNVFVLALDAFAPRPTAGANAAFLGVQNLVRANVLRQRKYATLTFTFRRPPSPLEFLGHLDRYKRIAERGREELAEERGMLARMMRPVKVERLFAELPRERRFHPPLKKRR